VKMFPSPDRSGILYLAPLARKRYSGWLEIASNYQIPNSFNFIQYNNNKLHKNVIPKLRHIQRQQNSTQNSPNRKKTVYCILKTYNNYTHQKHSKYLNNSKPIKNDNGTTLAKWDNVNSFSINVN
jgi:hypothetical protein